jgi:hypothetical protein
MNLALAYELPVPERESTAERFNAYLLNVDFESPDGRDWTAIGGGESVAEAIAAARGSLPEGSWSVARWNHLYGD